MPPMPDPDRPADGGPPVPAATTRTIRRTRGLPSSRAAVGGLLVAVAAIGTWVAASGQTGDDLDRYVVARHSIAPGVELREADLALVEVDLPERLRSSAFTDPTELVGSVARGPLGAGELVQSGSIGLGTVADGIELSFSVDPSWAVAGDLDVGDRIAVYATDHDGGTQLVLDDVHVLRIAAPDDSGLGGDGSQTITVASDDEAAVRTAVAATRSADVTVVRLPPGRGAGGRSGAEPTASATTSATSSPATSTTSSTRSPATVSPTTVTTSASNAPSPTSDATATTSTSSTGGGR